MNTAPPTQYLGPDLWVDDQVRLTIKAMLDEMEDKKGIVLQSHTVSELREKIRRRIRTLRKYGFDDEAYTREIIDESIKQRLAEIK
jgi:hypothetical protein